MSILVTGDLERPRYQGTNVEFIYHLISQQILNLSGIAPRLDDCSSERMLDEKNWIAKNVTSNQPGVLLNNPGEKLYISFEGPVNLWRDSKVPLVDIWVHPVRFMNDLVFGVRSNFTHLRQFAIEDYKIKYAAKFLQAGLTHHGMFSIPDNCIMFVGQLTADKSVLKDGKYYHIRDFRDEIREMVRDYERVIFAPHPFSTEDPDHLARELFNGAKEWGVVPRNFNTYRVMSDYRIKKVAGLSSSMLCEAKYFGKEVHAFLPCWWEDGFIPVDVKTFLSLEFWRKILTDVGIHCEYVDHDVSGEVRHNFIRDLVKCKWSYPY